MEYSTVFANKSYSQLTNPPFHIPSFRTKTASVRKRNAGLAFNDLLKQFVVS
jgi:hypothetical protein